MSKHSLEEDGFVILEGVLDPDEVRCLTKALSVLGHRRGRAGVRHLLKHPGVVSLANDPRLLAIARKALGDVAFPFRATLFDKSLRSNWLISWHQDTALPLCEKRETEGWTSWSVKDQLIYAHAPASALKQIVALRLHLDDSTLSNGPLRVLPGSHRLGVLDDDAILDIAQGEAVVSCAVRSGGVLAMRPLLIHASSKSHNQCRRRVLHIEYSCTHTFAGQMHLEIA